VTPIWQPIIAARRLGRPALFFLPPLFFVGVKPDVLLGPFSYESFETVHGELACCGPFAVYPTQRCLCLPAIT
jgi:hypothetical protein